MLLLLRICVTATCALAEGRPLSSGCQRMKHYTAIKLRPASSCNDGNHVLEVPWDRTRSILHNLLGYSNPTLSDNRSLANRRNMQYETRNTCAPPTPSRFTHHAVACVARFASSRFGAISSQATSMWKRRSSSLMWASSIPIQPRTPT